MSKNKTYNEIDLVHHMNTVNDSLINESDVGVAVIGTSYIDACLKNLLKYIFIKSSTADNLLNSTKGILGTYSSKADILYCMGIIEKTLHQDILKLAEIRNFFAHDHLNIKFTNENIILLSRDLHAPNGYIEHNFPTLFRNCKDARVLFSVTVSYVSALILMKSQKIKEDHV